jgi:FliI/YscN family ATPase
MSDVASLDLRPYAEALQTCGLFRWRGVVKEITGLVIESDGPPAGVGGFCEIQTRGGNSIRTQVAGFRNGRILSIPLDEIAGLEPGDPIFARSGNASVRVGPDLLGRVLDGFGEPMDGGPAISGTQAYNLYAAPPGPLEREPIRQQLETGIRAIDGLLPCGLGQRVGIFGGSGVGKSTLLGAMSRESSADVTVIALIGERNREVRHFLEQELGPEGRAKSVVVAATSDRPAPLRVRAGFVAIAVAEYFRDQGKKVLLVMDSVTRLAMAQREIGLAAGEPPSQKGYTPSVFAMMPKIFERAGSFQSGSITAFFTVLVEGDDHNEPIADAVRGILDGHIVLSRELGAAGHYPAIDILASVSRVAPLVSAETHLKSARKLREALAVYRQSEDLIQLGAYVSGSNPKLDGSIKARSDIVGFLQQGSHESVPLNRTLHKMGELASKL